MEPKKNLDWAKLLRDQVESAPKIIWDDSKPNTYTLRYKMKPEDIMTFVSGLHEVQADMIEATVAIKERAGFPEATELLNRIRALK